MTYPKIPIQIINQIKLVQKSVGQGPRYLMGVSYIFRMIAIKEKCEGGPLRVFMESK